MKSQRTFNLAWPLVALAAVMLVGGGAWAIGAYLFENPARNTIYPAKLANGAPVAGYIPVAGYCTDVATGTSVGTANGQCWKPAPEGLPPGGTPDQVLGIVTVSSAATATRTMTSTATRTATSNYYSESFESGDCGWTSATPPTSPSIVTDGTAPDGTHDLHLTRAGTGGDYFSPAFAVQGGVNYCLDFYVRWNATGHWPYVGIKPDTTYPAWVAGGIYRDPGAIEITMSTSWQHVQYTYAMPGGATTAQFTVELLNIEGSGTDEAWFDYFRAAPCAPETYVATSTATGATTALGTSWQPIDGPFVHGTGLLTGTTNYFPKKTASGWGDSSLSESSSGPVETNRVLRVTGQSGIVGLSGEGLYMSYSTSLQQGVLSAYSYPPAVLHGLSINASDLFLYGSSSVEASAGGRSFKFPTNDDQANDCLQTDGAGQTSWGPCTAGTNILPNGSPGDYAKIVTSSVVVTSTSTSTSTATVTSWVAASPLGTSTPVDVGARPASVGTSSAMSREDHKHHFGSNYPAPGWIPQGQGTGTETSTSVSASWVNPYSTAAPTADGTSGVAGTSTSYARSDHQHQGDGDSKVAAVSGATPQYLYGALVSTDSSVSISTNGTGTGAKVSLSVGSRPPTAHASTHLTGASDPISKASNDYDGLMSYQHYQLLSNASATPNASIIPISNASGKLDAWVSDASGSAAGKMSAAHYTKLNGAMAMLVAMSNSYLTADWTSTDSSITYVQSSDSFTTTSSCRYMIHATATSQLTAYASLQMRVAWHDTTDHQITGGGVMTSSISSGDTQTLSLSTMVYLPAGTYWFNQYLGSPTTTVTSHASSSSYEQVTMQILVFC